MKDKAPPQIESYRIVEEGYQDVGRFSENPSEKMRHSKISPAEQAPDVNGNAKVDVSKQGLRRRRSVTGSHDSESAKKGRVQKKYKRPYIARNYSQRECFKFVEKGSNLGIKLCSCGKSLPEHPKDVQYISDTSFKWLPDVCTRRVPTNSYGEIEFTEAPGIRKPYIRISHDTDALDLLRLMRQKWELDVPTLVISVTGGAKHFVLRPRLKEVFSRGLIKVAVSTGAWIITGGTNAGVMKHVGEAVKERGNIANVGRAKVNVIGITPWGVLHKSERLVSKNGMGLYPAHYSIEEPDSSVTNLDNNHSHFLLVDDGTYGRFGTEIELRSRVEGAIAKHLKTESSSVSGAIGIPVVILCLEGGPNTIKTMSEAIKKGVPAVIIEESGRAADVVCFAYRHLKYDEQRQVSFIDPEYVDDVKQKVAEKFGQQSMESVYAEILEMLRDEKMVTVFRFNGESGQSDMDLAILRALLKANKASFQTQLKLSLAWNRMDVAKSEIFTEDLKRDSYRIELLYEPLLTALLDDKPDFVELFLSEGVNIRNFMTLNILETLYIRAPVGSPLGYLLQYHLDRQDATSTIDMYVVGCLVEDLMGDRFKCRYKFENAYANLKIQLNGKTSPLEDRKGDEGLPTPNLDLFIWAVLSNRRAIARMVWERSRENIASALMASKLLKTMAQRITDHRELSDYVADLEQHGIDYEKLAVAVLDECRNEDEQATQALLVKELPDFAFQTSLDIAVAADDQDFIAHPSCQTLLSRLWMGALYINSVTYKVALCIFLPFLINVVITFREDIEDAIHTKEGIRKNSDLKGNDTDEEMIVGSEYSLDRSHDNQSFEKIELDEHKEESHNVLEHFDEQGDAVEIAIRKTRTSYFVRIVHFYQAPFVKFTVNVVSYGIFLFMYAFMVLTKFRLAPHPVEYVLQAWVLSLIFEEIRQVAMKEPKTLIGKFQFYFSDFWNVADSVSLSAFLVATVLRYVAYYYSRPNLLTAARIVLASDIVLFIIRLLQIFSVNRNIGPKLVMIQKMLTDLVYFIVILAVFVVGYGIARQAVLYPNSDLRSAVIGSLNTPYWEMYGYLSVNDILEDPVNCSTGQKLCLQPGSTGTCTDDQGKWVAPIYLALYMLFTNIILLNLLIAIFNYTFQKVQEDSDKVWKFQRFDLISEYHDRPAICPPLVVISHIYFLGRFFLQKCRVCGCTPRSGSSMRLKLSQEENERLSLWEFMATEAYVYRSGIRESETQDQRVKSILARVSSLSDEISVMKNGEVPLGTAGARDMFECRPQTHGGRMRGNVSTANLEARIAKLEYNVEQVLELLIQQSQKHAAILDASKHILTSGSGDSSLRPLSAGRVHARTRITSIHTKARTALYPGSSVQRFKISDDQVPWEVSLVVYEPVCYTAPVVLAKPYWADPDLLSISPRPLLQFNSYDDKYKVNRVSHLGSYDVIDGLPRNPMGRTGLYGRGLLGRFGPNHAADPIATRWKRTSSGIMLDGGKRVLEFIAIQRKDNHQWAIPGGMVEPGESVSETLRKEFTEEALAKLDLPEEKRKTVADRVAHLFKSGTEVYKGYVDDPRNTDNAWMETVACNFHDDTGESLGELQLQAGDDAQAVRWQRVSGNIPLFASHVGILEKVAKMHGAAFY